MAALSTVLQRRIISVYPWVNGQSDVYADVANVMLTPISERTGLSPLMIMWTRDAPNVGNVWLANHFVPLFRNSDRSASTSGGGERSGSRRFGHSNKVNFSIDAILSKTSTREEGGSISGTPRRE
jgi:hypothetical protein